MKSGAATAAALLSFAANSWLCRAALRSGAIDAASFTAIRLIAGALALAIVARAVAGRGARAGGTLLSAVALFAYAIAFSLAYLALDAGIGALVLFGAVQITMVAGGLVAGRRPTLAEVAGMALALGGLALLTLPGRAAPPLAAAALMAAAGVAWGFYSLRGRRESAPPLVANAGNFLYAAPLAAAAVAVAATVSPLHATPKGVLLALLSGAVTSGLGYAIWYAALPGLSAATAGLVQLAVPVVAAAGGVVLFGERLTPRLLAAGALVLAGIALALFAPRRRNASP